MRWVIYLFTLQRPAVYHELSPNKGARAFCRGTSTLLNTPIFMPQTHGYAAQSSTTALAPFAFERRAPGSTDVALDILFCGVCHSDLHTVRDEWGGTVYPAVTRPTISWPGTEG